MAIVRPNEMTLSVLFTSKARAHSHRAHRRRQRQWQRQRRPRPQNTLTFWLTAKHQQIVESNKPTTWKTISTPISYSITNQFRFKMDTIISSKICRICCNQRPNDLVSLLDAENKTIVKKLRACADITVSITDYLDYEWMQFWMVFCSSYIDRARWFAAEIHL